jgi:CubicO group peptidase (beta-lactamase class C family)
MRRGGARRTLTACILAAACLAVSASAVGGAVAPIDEIDPAAVDRFVQEYRARTGLPGVAVAVTRRDRVVYTAGYGHTSDGRPVTARTRFPVASLSKSFTALAVMQLVEAGRVELDAPVRRYLPEFVLADPRASRITVRQLLDHTSGMTDTEFREKSVPVPSSLQAAVTLLRSVRLASAPGTAFHYHNPNYWVAARLVEVASGEPFASYLDRHVLAPTGMTASTTVAGLRGVPGVARGHVRVYGLAVALPEPSWYLQGASGVVSTAEDLAHWLILQNGAGRARDGPRVVSARSLAEMHGRGLGWSAGPEPGEVSHGGWLFTYTARQVLLPGGYGIAVLANRGISLGPDDSFEIARGLVALTRGTAPGPVVPVGRIVDLVLFLVTAASLGLGIRALRGARDWARRWRARPTLPAALGLVGWILPIVLLVSLRRILSSVFGGRDATWTQLLYVAPTLAVWLAVAALLGGAVVLVRGMHLRRLGNRPLSPGAASAGLSTRLPP